MDKVIDRVRKLLSLANNNANINEAAAAAAQAQKLIAQHQLDMATIAVEEGKDSLSDEPIGISDVPLYEGKRAITWKGSLAQIIAENNACRVFLSVGTGNICVVGKPANIEMTRFLYSYVAAEIERLSEISLRYQGFGREGAKTWSNNFKLGAVSAVRDNLAAMKREVQAQAASSAMVLIRNEDQAVKSFVDNMHLRQKPKVKITHDISARAAGYQAGKNIDVNRTGLGVGAETHKLS